MAAGIRRAGGETERHARLKRLAFLWAQAQGYSACAMEVSLPNCRYRADVAAYRLAPKRIGSTAIFECKQALCDLRRDNCRSEPPASDSKRFASVARFSKSVSASHYPNLRNGDSLFPNSIPMISPRSVTVVTRAFCVSCVPCKIASTIAPSSTNCFAIAARICISSFCLRSYSAIRDSGRLGRSCRSRRRAQARPKTNLARNNSRESIRLLHRIAVAGTRGLIGS